MPGITKFMPLSSSSSTLSKVTQAATLALNAVQEQARSDVAHALLERDDALKALHDARMDAKDLEIREAGWKAAMDKSDLTIQHQTESIAQLRSEVQQWKTQLMRLEESSRQEIEGWKEQYRRAEHERSRLSARIEELIAGQLAWNAAAHAYTAPFTPRITYTGIGEPSSGPKQASTTSHRADSTPHVNVRAPAVEDDAPQTASRKSRSSKSVAHPDRESRSRGGSPNRRRVEDVPPVSGSRGTPRSIAASRAAPSQTPIQPRTQVIRRVTAIVDCDVKEEESDPGDFESAASGSVYDPYDEPATYPGGRRRRASVASTKHKRVAEEVDDWDEDEEGEYIDSNDGGEVQDAEDDELLLGPKTQPRKAARKQPRNAKQPRTGGGTKPPGSARKRKIDADGTVPSGRTGPAKAAKTNR